MLHDLTTTPDGEKFRHKCSRCGVEKITTTEKWFANCKAAPGLGDYVQAFTSLLGLKKCGGCERRRKWLNSLTKED